MAPPLLCPRAASVPLLLRGQQRRRAARASSTSRARTSPWATATSCTSSPGTHDTEGRRFYFQADSADDAAAWVSALVRERYFNVRDERDAYRDLQHDLSAQAAASRDALDEATEANDEAERRHVAAAKAEAELDDRLRAIARELDEDDDSEGEMPRGGRPELHFSAHEETWEALDGAHRRARS